MFIRQLEMGYQRSAKIHKPSALTLTVLWRPFLHQDKDPPQISLNQATERAQGKMRRIHWICMAMGVGLAPSSQFYFVGADVIPRHALPAGSRSSLPPHWPHRAEHCPHNRPWEGPGALWTTFVSHLETISVAREEKTHGWASPGSYVQA